MRAFTLLNRHRFLRGSRFDPFRNTEGSRLARKILKAYEADLDFALASWSADTASRITELLDLPEQIRGFGSVRERHAQLVASKQAMLRSAISELANSSI